MVMLVHFVHFPLNILQCQIYFIWFTDVLPVTVAPPLETLLTQFRKLQPSPLEIGDNLINIALLQKSAVRKVSLHAAHFRVSCLVVVPLHLKQMMFSLT